MAGRVPTWAWLMVLQLLLVVPFVSQPIHMDDAIFLDIGRHVVKTPWHPMDFPYIFEGQQISDMASHSHPPFNGYWIGMLLWLFGDGPNVNVTLHAGFIIFPLLFSLAMYLLALRFASTTAAAVVAITSPVAIVISHMLITDYPTLAFSTLSIALYVNGVDENKPRRVWIAGVLAAIAAFSSYLALMTSAMCWFYALMKRPRMQAAWWSPLVAPMWIAAWLALSSWHFHRFILGRTADYLVQSGGFNADRLVHKLLAFPVFMAGTLLLPLPLIRLAVGWARILPALVWASISVGLVQIYAGDYALKDQILMTILLTLGGWIFLGLFLRLRRSVSQDSVFLTVWAAMAIVQILFAYSSAMARYLLPLLPPMVLLTFLGSAKPSVSRATAVLCSTIGILVGICLSIADFEAAQTNREIAQYFGGTLKGWTGQTRFGGEWGLRHYMLEQGFRQFLTDSDDLTGGTFLLSPREAVPYSIGQDVQSMLVPLWQKSWQTAFPIRLMNRSAHAGFYSSSWGLLPYSFSRAPVEEVTVRQVSYLSEKLPEIQLESAEKLATILPVPVNTGGVDSVVPVPGRITLPYDGPSPVRVRFSCVAADTGECPIRIWDDRDSVKSPVKLHKQDSADFYFDLSPAAKRNVVLEFGSSDRTPPVTTLTIRNWVMLPLAGGS
jgi:4-amino-4-deoxy-L-arabinose transferase-like glycosyltransferase